MNTAISRDILTDLLPLYLSGDASPDTKALVEGYMQEDPEFARLIKSESEVVFPNHIPEPTREKEMEALKQTRREVRLRSWYLGLAIFFSVCPFSFFYDSAKNINTFMIRDSTGSAAIYAAIGVIFWVLYLRKRSRLQHTGI